MAELEGKFLGKVLKGKEIKGIKSSLEKDHPSVYNWIAREGCSLSLNKAESLVSYLDQTQAGFPFLAKTYLLHGYEEFPPEALNVIIKKLASLEFNSVTTLLADLLGKPFPQATLSEIKEKLKLLEALDQVIKLQNDLQAYSAHLGILLENLPVFHKALKHIHDLTSKLYPEDLKALSELFQYYGFFLHSLNIEPQDLSTLGKLAAEQEKAAHILQYIRVHTALSAFSITLPPAKARLDDYFTKTQKLLEHQTDLRFSQLLHHAADIQRIQTAMAAGKRITPEQAQVLLCQLILHSFRSRPDRPIFPHGSRPDRPA